MLLIFVEDRVQVFHDILFVAMVYSSMMMLWGASPPSNSNYQIRDTGDPYKSSPAAATGRRNKYTSAIW